MTASTPTHRVDRPSPSPHRTPNGQAARLTWRRLLLLSGITLATTFAAAGLVLRDAEAGGYAVFTALVTTWSARRRTRPPAVIFGLVCLNALVWMGFGALSNIAAGAGALGAVIPSLFTGLCAAGLAATVMVVARPGTPSSRGPALVSVGAAALAAALTVLGLLGGGSRANADLVVTTDNLAFTEQELRVGAGEVVVSVRNRDLFWHTFTVDELGVNLWVPVRGERSTTFTAPAGSYEFYCAIPGHEGFMRGSLVVE
jgi:plastocyanin